MEEAETYRVPVGGEARLFEAARPHLRVRRNDEHTLIAFDCADRLLDVVSARREVVVPAILLHDVGYSRLTEEEIGKAFGPDLRDRRWQRLHETRGALLAREILEGLDYPAEIVDAVCAIIEGHDSRAVSLNAEDGVVKDADKLYRYTPTGFSFVVEWFSYAPSEYLSLLDREADRWFFTAAAKAMARERLAQLARSVVGP